MNAGLPASPRQMAHTMLDFPVPLAPIIIFRWGPGDTSQISYVLNCKEVKSLNRTERKHFSLQEHFLLLCIITAHNPFIIHLKAS